jgi:hypothetical protein
MMSHEVESISAAGRGVASGPDVVLRQVKSRRYRNGLGVRTPR